MGAYVVRRLAIGVVLLMAMSLVTFLLFFASPGNPAQQACGKNCSPALIHQTSIALGYNEPVLTQWGQFLKGIVAGREYPLDPSLRKAAPQLISKCNVPCLGYSRVNTMNVTDEIKQAAPISFSLAIAALIMWVAGGVGFGLIAALRKGTIVDRGIVGVSLVFYAFPTFFIGLCLLTFVSIKWGLFPVPGYESIAEGGILGWAGNLFLPGLTLALTFMAAYVRMTRAFVLESMSEDYIRTARAKGARPRVVLIKHSLRAALTPLVTMVGLDFASLLGGAIITETVFNYNGLGKLAVQANLTLDLPTLIGLVVLLGAFVIVANIIVDLLYAVIDPRVRVG